MNHEKVKEILLSKKWKFAKTMATFPHSYTLEKNWTDKELYKEVSDYIKANGEQRLFFRRYYSYYKIDGHEYWAMNISDGTGIINRADVPVQKDTP